jgi:6-phosphogluconate dehydrogenase
MERIGLVGLGKMGQALAARWLDAGFGVWAYDPYVFNNLGDVLNHNNFKRMSSLEELVQEVRTIWLMIPAGDAVTDAVQKLAELCSPGAVIIDGGNSFFKDSIAHAQVLSAKNIIFIDCGVSGGLLGHEKGFALMIGGDTAAYEQNENLFRALAAPGGYAHVGPSGVGHYVKMIHNGIEYALLQSYAEGFQLLREGRYKNLDLAKISDVWHHGAIIDSCILKLIHQVFIHDQELTHISGKVAQTGMGFWTVREAHEYKIPVPLIEDAVKIRDVSQKTGGNYSTKLVALVRNKFGGHTVETL